jgi:hypothetical protein
MLVSAKEGLIDQARDPAPHSQHAEIGYNYRLSNVLAAIGRGQLRVLEDRVRRKREICAYYADTIGGPARHQPDARSVVGPLHTLAHLHHRGSGPVRRDARRYPPGAGAGGHRIAVLVETDAPAAGFPGLRGSRRHGGRIALPRWTLPAVRHSDE